MQLIVGLGNPGSKYKGSRHNVGFAVLDKLAERVNGEWVTDKKSKSLIINTPLKGENLIILSKPQTFMNSSGHSVQKIRKYYHIDMSDIWVIHDDLDIKLGHYKVQKNRGPKVHNGVTSIEEATKSRDFWRFRIGIENRGEKSVERIPGEKYVLEKFSSAEEKILEKVTDEVTDELLSKVAGDTLS